MKSLQIVLLTAAGITACGRVPSSDPAGTTPAIVLDTASGAESAGVEVTGLTASQRRALQQAQLSVDAWQKVFRVTVIASDSVAVVGKYNITGDAVRFTPMFPLVRGREYRARFDATGIAAFGEFTPLVATLTLPRANLQPSARIVRVLPAVDTVPSNLLRIYVEFSAPMSRSDGLPHVKLLDERGDEVPEAFLPLEADFWSGDATRYTFFLDPGRVKRGILSNRQLGRALEEGRMYTIALDSTWLDELGQPLVSGFRRSFRAGPPIDSRVTLAEWKVDAPKAGGRGELVVRFPRPLDYGLMQRAIGILDPRGRSFEGDVTIPSGEREWRFTPRTTWRAGEYQLLILGFLEDPSGNRIDRPFEVDMFERTDRDTAPERHLIPVVVSG